MKQKRNYTITQASTISSTNNNTHDKLSSNQLKRNEEMVVLHPLVQEVVVMTVMIRIIIHPLV